MDISQQENLEIQFRLASIQKKKKKNHGIGTNFIIKSVNFCRSRQFNIISKYFII